MSSPALTLQELKDHALLRKNQPFNLNSTRECLACDLMVTRNPDYKPYASFGEITDAKTCLNTMESTPIDPQFCRLTKELVINHRWRTFGPAYTGAELAKAIQLIQDGMSPRDAARAIRDLHAA